MKSCAVARPGTGCAKTFECWSVGCSKLRWSTPKYSPVSGGATRSPVHAHPQLSPWSSPLNPISEPTWNVLTFLHPTGVSAHRAFGSKTPIDGTGELVVDTSSPMTVSGVVREKVE